MTVYGAHPPGEEGPVVYENVVDLEITMNGFTKFHLWDIARRFPNLQKVKIHEQGRGMAWEGGDGGGDYLYTDIVGIKSLKEVTLPWTKTKRDANGYEM
ncbi:hypothetical protein AA313_de0205585 [Arthrobotrys entomopaga]|nr:hypothetical protein AA313_de0205585 [Arthrobotrys entomopaga]